MVNVYIVCRDGHQLYEKYLQNLSGGDIKVVRVYFASQETRKECLKGVLGYALYCAQDCDIDLVICENGLYANKDMHKCRERRMCLVDLETLFSLQVSAFVNQKSVAEGFRWLARKIVEMREVRKIIIFSPELFDAPLGGLDGQLEYDSKNSKINMAWVCEQLNRVFPVVPKEIVSEPDFLEERFKKLPETTLLLTGGRIWSRARNSTPAMFFPLPFSCATLELMLANPLASFNFSLEKLYEDIVSFNEYPFRK